MNPVRIGIVGCGNVLSAYLTAAERVRPRNSVEVVAACGRPAQRDMVLCEVGIPRFTTDYRELVEWPEVDLVLVLTSAQTHAEITRAALKAGKHVLTEKPYATSLEDAAELVELARRSPGLWTPAPFTVLSPTFQAMRRRIQNGDIGKPCSARARYGWAGPGWNRWFYQPGGGPLLDLSGYNLTTLTGLLGPARRVMAMTGTLMPEREVEGQLVNVEVEDNAQVLIDFGDCCFAVVTTGFVMQQYRCPGIEVYGTEGTIQMLGDDWDPDGYELWQNRVGAWQVFKESDPDWPWTDGLRHIVECIRDKTRPLVTPEQALHVVEIALQAAASGRDGQAKPIHSTFTPPEFPSPPPSSEPAHLIHDRLRRTVGKSEGVIAGRTS
jgi:predicted dehydrogenase